MRVGLLVITHGDIGRALLATATAALGGCPLSAEVLSVAPRDNPEHLIAEANRLIARLDRGDGVIVLTDMYGSTPGNIAAALDKEDHVRVIAGINLPMLIRLLNYPALSLDQLAQKAISGGRDGIFRCREEAGD